MHTLSQFDMIDQQGQTGGNAVAPKSIYLGDNAIGCLPIIPTYRQTTRSAGLPVWYERPAGVLFLSTVIESHPAIEGRPIRPPTQKFGEARRGSASGRKDRIDNPAAVARLRGRREL